ncbi:MAG: NADH-quinone oxidoreductase subunit J [Vulcanimicrobiaceae bacterium]
MILFYVLAIVLIASAIFTITQKSPVYSVVGLLLNFITLAALYFTLNAEFLGVIQIVVYTGAILMLFVFVIALLSSGIGPFREGPNRLPKVLVPALGAVLAALGFLIYGLGRAPLGILPAHALTSTAGDVGTANVFGSVGDFGVALFTTHLLPFEVTAFVLMVAVIGVVLLAGEVPVVPPSGTHPARKARSRERESIVKAIK